MGSLALVIVLTLLGLAAGGPAFGAEAEVFDFKSEIAKTNPQAGAASRFLVRRPEFTVNAVVVREEIPTHQHDDGSHVLYIVSGQGTATIDGKPVALKPGVIVHIPQGIVHSIKAQRGKLTFVDFVQHAFDPTQAERPK